MRRFILAGLMLAMVLAPGVGRAQEDAPWPPDPAEIFAAGVEVVSVEVDAPETSISTRPVLVNEARVLRVYDEGPAEWREYSYPDEVVRFDTVYARSDDTLVLNTSPSAVENQWLFNPETGEFTRPDFVCGDILRALAGEGRWVLYTHPRFGERSALCHTETGELRGLLPTYLRYWWYIFESPTGAWLLVVGSDTDHPHSMATATVYAYEIATEQMTYLGEMYIGEIFEVERWYDGTRAIIYSGDMPESLPKEYYFVDVTQADSLQYAISGRARYYENPPRYGYLETQYMVARWADLGGLHVPCTYTVFFPSAGDTTVYDLAYDCGNVFAVSDEEYVYLGFSPNQVESSLYHINVGTGERTQIISGEFEWLEYVSPDGRYAVLLLDDNGRVDWAGEDVEFHGLGDRRDLANPRIVVFDTLRDEFVYEVEHRGGYPEIEWFDENIFFLRFSGSNEGSQLVILNEDGTYETLLENRGWVSCLSPDHQWLLVRADEDGTPSGINVFNLFNEVELPVIRAVDSIYYSLSYECPGVNNLMEVRVRPASNNNTDYSHQVVYTIRIPQPES